LDNLAQDVALSIRLAQSYGLNVRGDGSGAFEASYGVHFDKATVNPAEYIIYRDTNRGPDFKYDVSGIELERFFIGTGYTIADVCLVDSVGVDSDCFFADGAELDAIDVAFDRPKPDANFVGLRLGAVISTNYKEVIITVREPDGVTKEIHVLATGYINTQ
jgi:hypothetical protein